MSSKPSKRKNKNIKPQAQKANRETYFASDRIKHLPSGRYYTAVTNLQEAAVYVFITREHINGRIAFAFFGIKMFTGEIINSDYNFNIEKEYLEELKEKFQLEPFKDKPSLKLLVYDAVEVHLKGGYPTVPGLLLARNILCYDYVNLKNAAQARRLFEFQNPDFDQAISSDEHEVAHKIKTNWISYNPTDGQRLDKRALG